MIASIGQLWFHSDPSRALDRPRMEATERSISPATMTKVIGSAMSATSVMSDSIELKFPPVRKSGEESAPATIVTTSSATVSDSHRATRWRRSADPAGTPLLQGAGDAQHQQPVEGD